MNPNLLPLNCYKNEQVYPISLACCLTCNHNIITNAVQNGDINKLRETVQHGYLPVTINDALMKAVNAKINRRKIFEELLNLGADPNYSGFLNILIVLISIKSETIDILNLFLDKGADPNLINERNGCTALKMACNLFISKITINEEKKNEIINLLLARGADFDKSEIDIEDAIKSNRLDFVNRIIEKGINLSSTNYDNLLSLAIINKNLEIAKVLLLNGVNYNLYLARTYNSKFLNTPEFKQINDFPFLMLLYCLEKTNLYLNSDNIIELNDLII